MFKKRNIATIKKIYKSHDCELLEEIYHNNRDKLKFRCKCGQTYQKSLCQFMIAPRCRMCGNKKISESKYIDKEAVKKFFQKNACELLEDYEYVTKPMLYKCVCGTISKISFDNFKRGKRCQNCKKIKCSGPNHHAWKSDREALSEAKLIRKKCYKAIRSTLQKIGQIKEDRTYNLLGYSPKELHQHLLKFQNWLEIRKTKWHLDHIFPIQAFIDFNITDIKLINCLENLQPLTAKDNLTKNDAYNAEDFKKWLNKKGFKIVS